MTNQPLADDVLQVLELKNVNVGPTAPDCLQNRAYELRALADL